VTPLQINTAARQQYNAVNDSRYSDLELYDLIYAAQLDLANEAFLIEAVLSTTTVASTQEYDFPTRAIAVKRVTYNGTKLSPISFREDDVLTVLNQTVSTTGTPSSYAFFDDVFYLRPVPNAAKTLKVWAFTEPSTVSATSVMDIPTLFHMSIVNFLLSKMSAKDKNYEGASYYWNLWEKDMERAKRFSRKRHRGDAFSFVKSVDIIHQLDIGSI